MKEEIEKRPNKNIKKLWIKIKDFALLDDDKIYSFIEDIKEKYKNEISFEELTNLVKPHIKEEKGKSLKINPQIVISVTYQEIQHSPNYSSGFALRFPRFTALRPDKKSTDANNIEEIGKDFLSQKRNWRYG